MAINKTVRNAISDGAVTSDKIEDGAITSSKLGAGSISLSKTPLGNAAPTISSLDTSQIDPDSGATVTITGTGFVSIPDVRFMNTSTGVRIQASTVGFTSSTTITAAFPSGQTPGTYKVLVENPDGKGAISTSTITYSAAPTWSTAANLGSIEEGEAVNIQLLAYDDNSTAVSSYSLISGSLPSGVTLSGDSSVGALTGTAPAVDADTTYTFTIRATDDESQTSDREFTLTITNWTVANSLRFDDGSSDYLNRTPSSASNRTTWTWSAWIKRSNITGGQMALFGAKQDSSNDTGIWFESDESLKFFNNIAGTVKQIRTNRLFRDLSAWYHIVAVWDTTNGTAGDRMKLYVNGTEETSFQTDTNPGSSDNSTINNTQIHQIGRVDSTYYFDGYMTEVVLIDGQALTPSSFGETDTDSGIWKPKKISGLTFGTNGFYLPFTNSGSLGADSSGNSNDFTVNNLTAIDQTTDTPINNYATMNPIASQAGSTSGPSGVTFSNGNLEVGNITSETSIANLGADTGKWYWEVKVLTDQDGLIIGAVNQHFHLDAELGYNSPSSPSTAKVFGYYGGNGNKTNSVGDGSHFTSYGSSIAVNDIVGVAMNLDDNQVTFYLNGSSQGTFSITALGDGEVYFPAVGNWSLATITTAFNFGNPSFSISSGNSDANGYGNFEYAVPSGYFALNTKNLAEYG